MKSFLIGILFVAIATITLIGFITSSKNDGIAHWAPYLWLNALVYVNWHISTIILSDSNGKSIFGVLPSTGMIVSGTSIVSAFLGFVASSMSSILSPWHLITQILLISGTIILCLMFILSSQIASSHIKSGVITRKKVIGTLKRMSLDTDDEIAQQVKRAVNIIEYDLPHESKLYDDPRWATIASEILECEKISRNVISEWLTSLQRI